MNPMQELNEAEIDELDNFLLSDATPDNCMDLPTLDGFFAALVLNPEFVMPSEYLPWVWDIDEGKEMPSFASNEQASHIMGLVLRYYNSVLDAIRNETFSPLFYILAQEDGSEFYDAEGWCEGFMRGVFLFSEPWTEIFESYPELIEPMVLLGTEHGWEMLDKNPDIRQLTQEAYESIAGAVALLAEHFTVQREALTMQPNPTAIRVEPVRSTKVGRNDECPCGSGKKFKKCCGAPTLH